MGMSKPFEELSESYKKVMPKALNGRHRALMRKLCAGITLKVAAEELGMCYQSAMTVNRSPLFQKEIKRMQEQIDQLFVAGEADKDQIYTVRERIKSESPASLDKLLKLRDNAESEGVQERVSMDLLNRAGLKAVEKVEVDATVEVGESVADALKHALKILREGREGRKPILPPDGFVPCTDGGNAG